MLVYRNQFKNGRPHHLQYKCLCFSVWALILALRAKKSLARARLILAIPLRISIGIGKNLLEPLSAAMVDKVWRCLNCRAVGEAAITPAASFSAQEVLSSPSAEITYKNSYYIIH